MIRRICFFTGDFLSEPKRYFTLKLAEALNRLGVKATIIDRDNGSIEILKLIQKEKPDLVCSFNSSPTEKENVANQLELPYLSLVVDPIFYHQHLMDNPYSIISCVDRFDCEFVQSKGFERVFFFPHAVEKELHAFPNQPRPYEVVLVGNSYDPESWRKTWEGKYDRKICQVIEYAIEIGFAHDQMSFWEASLRSLEWMGIDQNEVNVKEIACFVDHYMRGQDRLELVRSITDASVHIFGGSCQYEGLTTKGWESYLSDRPNVTLHKGVEFVESLEIFKQSKICLNSVPSFRNGTHERVFISLACGCLPITNESLYLRENFVDGEELVFYQFDSKGSVNEKINHYLSQESERLKIVESGRKKVMKKHTWDSRAELLLQKLRDFIAHKS